MSDPKIAFLRETVRAVKVWGEAKRTEGFIPTIDMFVEDMTEYIDKLEK